MSTATEADSKMYAVVRYSDYRKENTIEVMQVTPDLDSAKKAAFHGIKRSARDDDKFDYKIVKNNYEDRAGYVYMEGKVIVEYSMAACEKEDEREEDTKWKRARNIDHYVSDVWSIVEVKCNDHEALDDIDESMFME